MSNAYHTSGSSYSADVSIYLQADSRRIEVAGVLDNRCTLRQPTRLEPCEADLVIAIDGHEYRKRVSFYDGISDQSLEVEYGLPDRG